MVVVRVRSFISQHLKEFNFNTVKIDGSLVKEILYNKNCQKIVSSMVCLGQTLNYTVLAEFVETKEQMELLRHLGASFFKGIFFKRQFLWMRLWSILKLGSERRKEYRGRRMKRVHKVALFFK